MATAIDIRVNLDDSGVVTGVKNINSQLDGVQGGLQKTGQKGNVVLTGLERDHRKAAEAAQFLSNIIGVQLPQGFDKVLGKMPGVSGALAATFKVALILAFAEGVAKLVTDFESVEAATRRAEVQLFAFLDALSGDRAGIEGQKAIKDQQRLADLLDHRIQMEGAAAAAGKEGYAAVSASAKQAIVDVQREANAKKTAIEAEMLDADHSALLITMIDRNTAAETIAIEKRAAGERMAIRRQLVEQTKQLEHERNLAQLEGASAILEKERQAIEDIDRKAAAQGAQRDSEVEKARVLAHDLALRQIGKLEDDYARKMDELTRGTTASSLQGVAKVTAETKDKVLQLELEFMRTFGALAEDDKMYIAAHRAMEEAKTAITQAGEEQRRVIRRASVDETEDLERRAAIAGIAEANRTTATIVEDYRERIRQISEAEADLLRGITVNSDEYVRITEDANRRRAAAWTDTNAKLVDENRAMVNTLGDQLLSIWDDIANGNIGKTILNLFKKLIAQMIAQWLLGIGVMKQAFVGGQQSGTGILGGLMQMIFGGGSGGGGTAAAVGGGATAAAAGFNVNFGGGGPAIIGAGGGLVGPSSTAISGGNGTAGMAASQAASGGLLNNLFTGIFGKGSVNFLGKNVSAAGLGSAGLMLGISGIASGLMGGGVLGSGLQGALGGIMTGFALGGPLGAAAGAGIFLASLLAGIFGAGDKKKDAERQASLDAADFKKIVAAYEDYQLTFDQAKQQLSQSYTQARANMAQFGPGASAGIQALTRPYGAAQKEIYDIEQERNTRRNLGLTAPEFHSGGEVTATLEVGEHVVRNGPAQRYRGLLEAMNSGTAPEMGGDTYIVQLLDTTDGDAWLRRNARAIRASLRRENLNYQE